jgi:hypothetical protein
MRLRPMRIGLVGMLVGEDIEWKNKKIFVCFVPSGIHLTPFVNTGEKVAAGVCLVAM